MGRIASRELAQDDQNLSTSSARDVLAVSEAGGGEGEEDEDEEEGEQSK